VSRYEVKAGTVILAVLLTGVNSGLPGQLIGQVREPVFDTETDQPPPAPRLRERPAADRLQRQIPD
jgi:hypothetical protein